MGFETNFLYCITFEGMCTMHVYKACVQGMCTMHVYNACVQGMCTRHVYKACVLGMCSTRELTRLSEITKFKVCYERLIDRQPLVLTAVYVPAIIFKF